METLLPHQNADEVCRLCLESSQILQNIMSCDDLPNSTRPTLRVMIFECTSIEVKEKDGLPVNICTNCLQQVEKMYHFRLKCLSSDAILRSNFSIMAKPKENVVTSRSKESSAEIQAISLTSVPLLGPPEVKQSARNMKPTDMNGDNLIGHNHKKTDLMSCHSSSSSISSKVFYPLISKCSTRLSYKKKKGNKVRFACQECKKVFKHSYSLSRHRLSHRRKLFFCEHCKKYFCSQQTFDRHRKTHSGDKPYKCHLCDKSYVSSSSYSAHLRKHTGEKPYKCSDCPESFYLLTSFDRHVAKHVGVRNYTCKVCSASFWVGDDLRAHVNRVH